MKLPQNGSAVANCMLVVAGAALGAGIMWVAHGTLNNKAAHSSEKAGPGHASHMGDSDAFSISDADARQQINSALDATEPMDRSNRFHQAAVSAARNDVLDALRLGSELDSHQDRLDYHRGLFGEWAESDPVAALTYAHDNFEAGILQSDAIGIVINKWGASHPHEAWVWSDQNLTGPLKERAQTDLLVGWTRRTPDLASKWLLDSGLTTQPLINAVARTWAEQDPLGAAAWARLLPEGVPQQTADVAVATEWASRDPEAATAQFNEAASQEEGVNLAIALADVWGTADPAATAEWISRLPNGTSRDNAAAALATVWGASDIQAAVAWSQGLQDASMRRQVIAHLGTTWGAIEPMKAIEWLTALPTSEAADGITGAFYSWAGTAPEQLGQWINDEPPTALTDQARLSLGDVLTASDAPSAMELALGINSPDRRAVAVSRFFRHWRRTDDPGAQDWVDANWPSLPADARDRIEIELAREVHPR